MPQPLHSETHYQHLHRFVRTIRTSSRFRPHFRQKTASSAYTLPQAGQLACKRLTGFGNLGCRIAFKYGFCSMAAQLLMLNVPIMVSESKRTSITMQACRNQETKKRPGHKLESVLENDDQTPSRRPACPAYPAFLTCAAHFGLQDDARCSLHGPSCSVL